MTLFPLMAGLETEHENLAPFSSEVTGDPPFSLSTWGTNHNSVLPRSDQSQLSITWVTRYPPSAPVCTRVSPPRTSLPSLYLQKKIFLCWPEKYFCIYIHTR